MAATIDDSAARIWTNPVRPKGCRPVPDVNWKDREGPPSEAAYAMNTRAFQGLRRVQGIGWAASL